MSTHQPGSFNTDSGEPNSDTYSGARPHFSLEPGAGVGHVQMSEQQVAESQGQLDHSTLHSQADVSRRIPVEVQVENNVHTAPPSGARHAPGQVSSDMAAQHSVESGSPLKNRRGGHTPQYYEPMPTISEGEQRDPLKSANSTPTNSNVNSMSATFSSLHSTATTSTTTTNPSSAPVDNHLTVEGEWKVEVAQKERKGDERGGVVVLALVKWMVTIVMMLALLVCLISVKLSVLVLSKQLQNAQNATLSRKDSEQWTRYSAQFIVLYLLLSVPPLLNALRAAWYGLLDSTVPWPSRRAVMWAVIRAALESLGLCLMCYKVIGEYESPLSLLLLATPLFLPALDSLIHMLRARRHGQAVQMFEVGMMVVGMLVCLVTVILTIVLLAMSREIDKNVWHVVAAVVVLSIAWLPSLQKCFAAVDRQLPGVSHRAAHAMPDGTDTLSYGTFSTDTISSNVTLGQEPQGPQQRADYDSISVAKSGSTWKSAFIVHACRLLFTFLASTLIFILDSGGGPDAVLTDTVHQAFLDAWNLPSSVTDSSTWTALGVGLGAGLLGYALAFGACHMDMMRGALAPPLVLAMPLAVLVVAVKPICNAIVRHDATCTWDTNNVATVVAAALCFLLAHLLIFGLSLLRSAPNLLQQESVVFWLPGYNGPALDTYLLVNRRRDVIGHLNAGGKGHPNKVYICTTMYREAEDEMRQLLESINEIRLAAGYRLFESHIILDGGVRSRELSEFALTLVSLLDTTLGVRPEACTKTITPYGMKLSWALPGPRGRQMPFSIHLKDNLLVKNKKRWSQVMYMSYILDFLTEDHDDDSFILTTDADVVFTPDSVEALLDFMTRDHSIGAVCARTHPMGSGPLVWYQMFEYAIGHWFQKAAEHVLGSVLCSPGCFSVYRCRALADVLPKYARRVESAFDFLTKDMGEDRWLCTLMVQSGWRIEYCATSENSTNCPAQFDEFYKQRRRWIASTLANLMLIVKEWKYVRKLNHRVSYFFLLYQVLLLCSTLLGPSTIIFVVMGGMNYAWAVNNVVTVLLQLVLCVAFAALCIYAPQHVQLKVAKLYTFFYALLMMAVSVGLAEQIVDDVSSTGPTPSSNSTQPVTTTPSTIQHISVDLPISVTTLYFAGLVSIFMLAALLHVREFLCLIYGVLYLICLPSGYLVLTIYSICNITDSSWGTREQQEDQSAVQHISWHQHLMSVIQRLCFCCVWQKRETITRDREAQTVSVMTTSKSLTTLDTSATPPSPRNSAPDVTFSDVQDQETIHRDEDTEFDVATRPVPVEEWLPAEMRKRYAGIFKKHGFDSTLFIAGMREKELRHIGVTSAGHLHYLLDQVALIPAFEIEYKVPTNVDQWLEEIGLPMYRDNFHRNHIRQPKEMEILKSFGRKEIERELGITEDGHIKRLMYAIAMLRDPTEAQQKAIRMRQVIEGVPMNNLRELNAGEYAFWERLRECCLQPDLKAFGLENEVKVKLSGLRNDWLLVLAVSNTLWLILITTLASAAKLTLVGANPLGLIYLAVFGALFVIQFLAMLQHRLATLTHFLARAPYRCGRPLQTSWSFKSADYEDIMDRSTVEQVRRDAERAWERVVKPKRRRQRPADKDSETAPLVV